MKNKKLTKKPVKKTVAKKVAKKIIKKTTAKSVTKKSAGTYIDGFVMKIPSKSLAAYKKLAETAKKVWLDHGALQYVETIGDDLNIKMGVPFTTLTKTKKDEIVVFSWIVYKSKAHRDQVNAKVMKDKRISCDPSKMPFDCNEMTYGGFKIIVSS